ncbi:hypothetical protein BpHYR1_042124 [Brachionus plicatilis]|uniref:Uncharacterized protein n=1 Tax=Brachionus plicatilis TaxID=10195 RepID=A0A3M7R3C2_BRAPC|nr:hypothetical protein BpHYR1_042124 [Brachionus plicatilis]
MKGKLSQAALQYRLNHLQILVEFHRFLIFKAGVLEMEEQLKIIIFLRGVSIKWPSSVGFQLLIRLPPGSTRILGIIIIEIIIKRKQDDDNIIKIVNQQADALVIKDRLTLLLFDNLNIYPLKVGLRFSCVVKPKLCTLTEVKIYAFMTITIRNLKKSKQIK